VVEESLNMFPLGCDSVLITPVVVTNLATLPLRMVSYWQTPDVRVWGFVML
jgi:hypothetical protein